MSYFMPNPVMACTGFASAAIHRMLLSPNNPAPDPLRMRGKVPGRDLHLSQPDDAVQVYNLTVAM
jgi:hypothetical protein